MKTRTRSVVCCVEAGFDALALGGVCQVLSEAGSIWNWRAYRLEIASRAGGLITSNAQQQLQTRPFDACSEPEIVVVGAGPPVAAAGVDDPEPDLLARWPGPTIEWVGLRAGLIPIVRSGRFKGATVAASARLQPRLLAAEPTLQFAAKPWHVEGTLWSSASADATELALTLVQRHVGNSARRAVETSLGLTTSFSSLRVNLTKPGASE